MARRITIRAATPSDLPAAAQLLRLRDGRDHRLGAVETFLEGFRSDRALGWIAFDDARPVGLSMIYLREVLDGETRYRVGYWGNLFVDPDYRKAMVYPRLPLAMFRGSREAGIDFVLTATRREESSGVHLQLGCREIGQLPVQMKPLRPVRLLAQRRPFPGAGLLSSIGDPAFGALLRVHALPERLRGGVEELHWAPAELAELIEIRRSTVAARVHRSWTPAELADRFRGTLEDDRYTLVGARRRGKLIAAAAYRIAERGGVRAGVVLDVWARAGEGVAVSSVLAQTERRARREGADVMLALVDGEGDVAHRFRRLGWLRSPETYRVLLWPKEFAPKNRRLLDVAQWSFHFSDHDAF